MSRQSIYEQRARLLVVEIGTLDQRDIEKIKIKFNDLLKLAKLIENIDFLLTLRYIDISDRSTMKQFLTFLIENIKFENNEIVYADIHEQILRLNTLQLIDPNESNWDWKEFMRHPSLIKVITSTFKKVKITFNCH